MRTLVECQLFSTNFASRLASAESMVRPEGPRGELDSVVDAVYCEADLMDTLGVTPAECLL